MDEIVAAMSSGAIITNNSEVIVAWLEEDKVTRWLSRQEMQFMASADLGGIWEALANSRVLFLLDDDGKPLPARNCMFEIRVRRAIMIY